jgi:putative membrane protein
MKRALFAAIATAGLLLVAAPAGASVAHHGHDSPTGNTRAVSTDHHSKQDGTGNHQQTPTPPPSTSQSTPTVTSHTVARSVSARDAAFLVTATSGALTEIQAGQLAVDQGSAGAVRSYGQRLVDDHTRELTTLQWIASVAGVTLPTAPDATQQGELATLAGTDSASFDTAFLSAAVTDHRAAIKLFTKEAYSSRRGVARFARMELPMLRKHLRIAQFGLWWSHWSDSMGSTTTTVPTTVPTTVASA